VSRSPSAESRSKARPVCIDAGYRPSSLDLTIVAARPRLAGHLDEMRLAIAGLVGLDANRVNVKASTGNLEGWEGAGRGISASAVAVVESGGAGRPRPQ
jgi:2-C-methyl-D-erythritol 2,4-cyclodiphosphate synthase